MNGDPAGIVSRWKRSVQVTQEDATYALNLQKDRILKRTAAGVDFESKPFAPYSTKGPYYYYPNGRVGSSKFSDRQNKAAASRLKAKLAKVPTKGAGEIRLTRTGKGIVFASYAAFKRWLGRTGIDLYGPRAPHMLQALVVKVAGAFPREGRLGIYGAEADRASGHNYGTRRLPKRKFLGASVADKAQIIQDIARRIMQRAGGKQ